MGVYLGVVIVVTTPGLLVAYLLRMPLGTLATWAAIPPLSLATVFLLGQFTALTGVSFGVPSFLLLLLGLGGLAVVKHIRSPSRHRRDLFGQSSEVSSVARLEAKFAHGLLLLGVLIGLVIWWRGLRGVPLVLPGADGTREGFMVGRIVHGQSIDVSKVLVSDAGGLHQVWNFFPLGGHASAAIATRLTGADVGQVLVALTVVFAAVALPLGMFVLARFLAPERPLIAGFTAVTVPALTLFPYPPIGSGDISIVLGMALVPVSVLVLARAVLTNTSGRRFSEEAVLVFASAALTLVAVMSVHSSEIPLIVFLVALLVLERAWLARRVEVLFAALMRALTVALLAILLFAPTLGAFVSTISERSGLSAFGVASSSDWKDLLGPVITLRTYFPPTGFAAALPQVPSETQVLLAALALAGVLISVWHKRVAWAVGWGTVIALTLLASTSDNEIIRALTFPWYRGSIRLNLNQAFFAPFFAAIPLALAVGAFARIARPRSAMICGTLAATTLFMAFIAVPGYRTSGSILHSTFSVKPGTHGNQARVDDTSTAAFEWLDDHAADDDTVVNQPTSDGSLWMYTQRGVRPLVALRPTTDKAAASTDWQGRSYLAQHVQEVGRNRRVDLLVRRYHARWIYFDTRNFPVAPQAFDLEELHGNPHISQAFRQRTVYVFKIDPGDHGRRAS